MINKKQYVFMRPSDDIKYKEYAIDVYDARGVHKSTFLFPTKHDARKFRDKIRRDMRKNYK